MTFLLQSLHITSYHPCLSLKESRICSTFLFNIIISDFRPSSIHVHVGNVDIYALITGGSAGHADQRGSYKLMLYHWKYPSYFAPICVDIPKGQYPLDNWQWCPPVAGQWPLPSDQSAVKYQTLDISRRSFSHLAILVARRSAAQLLNNKAIPTGWSVIRIGRRQPILLPIIQKSPSGYVP